MLKSQSGRLVALECTGVELAEDAAVCVIVDVRTLATIFAHVVIVSDDVEQHEVVCAVQEVLCHCPHIAA